MAEAQFTPNRPLRVYLAGRINRSDWRHVIVDGLNDWQGLPRHGALWPEMPGAVFGHTYVGPYFESGGHGEGHVPTAHGCGSGKRIDDGNHGFELDRTAIFTRCLLAIQQTDLLFAWIDSRECFGTLTEIGYAARSKTDIDIVIAGPHGRDEELWFAGNAGRHCDISDPVKALRAILPVLPERIDYRAYILSPEWRARADAAKVRAGYRCQVCNKGKDQIVLDAHHRTYERLGREQPDDITVLCRACHELYERNRKAAQAGVTV